MGDNNFVVRSAILATKEKNPNRYLDAGKKERGTGFFFYLLEIYSSDKLVQKTKKAILDKIDKLSEHLDINESIFEELVEEINGSIEKVLEIADTNMLGKINAVFGYAENNKIFLTQSGRLPGYIFRKSKISSLTEGIDLDSPNPMQIFKDIISGELVFGDRLIFGNNELYNHLSLDRIRKCSADVSAKEAIAELFSTLRKLKISSVNAIIIETNETVVIERIKELPEVLYLDEPEETFLSIFKKKYLPKIMIVLNTIWAGLKKFGHFTAKGAKAGATRSKKYWDEKASPKTKEWVGHSRKVIASKVSPNIQKFQTDLTYNNIKVKNPYATKQKSGFVQTLLSIKAILLQLLKILAKKNNRKYLYIGLIIIVLLFGYFRIASNNTNVAEKRDQQQVSDAYDKALAKFNQAKEDIALGKGNGLTDLAGALTLAEKGKEYPPTKDKSTELAREISAQMDTYTKTTRIYPDEKNSVTLSNEVSTAVTAGNEIYAFSKDKKVYALNLSDNSAKLIAALDKEVGDIKSLVYAEVDNKILIYTTDSKMFSYDIKAKTSALAPVTEGTAWIPAVSFSIFSANLYLLNPDTGEIIKYIKEAAGYSKSATYADSKKVSLKESASIAVDGSVFVLFKNGTAIKLARGVKDDSFVLRNIPEPGKTLEEPKKIYTGVETTYIYVLESKLNRILRFNKSGEFVSQYALGDGTIDDFVVNEKLKKLILLSGKKIVVTEL